MLQDSQLQKNVILAPFTTFGIGGSADMFIVVASVRQLIDAVMYARQHGLPFFVLGTGANILVGDRGFRGLVIKNEAKHVELQRDKNTKPQSDGIFLTAESGVTIAELIDFTREKGLSGFEHYAGIPSSLGGALWQNLHFLSPDRTKTVFIGDIVQEAQLLEIKNQKINNVSRDYFQFSYDYSILHDTHDIVLSAILRLMPEDPKIIQERIDANLTWRKEKHPKNSVKTSAGSIFKKIEGVGAGRLIEKAGLKGKRIGGAQVSEHHANFIVNTGNATASDIRGLIAFVQKEVQEKTGYYLEPEISFVGEF